MTTDAITTLAPTAAASRPPPAPIRFRPATDADRAAVEALQQVAYDRERLLGLEPPPLKADYAEIIASMEVWLAEERTTLRGVLILDVKPDDLVIWSIAAAPDARGQGLGQIMLDAAEVRAEQLGRARAPAPAPGSDKLRPADSHLDARRPQNHRIACRRRQAGGNQERFVEGIDGRFVK